MGFLYQLTCDGYVDRYLPFHIPNQPWIVSGFFGWRISFVQRSALAMSFGDDVAVQGHDVVGEEDDGVGGGSSSRGAVILLTGSTFQVDLYVAKSSLQITGITHLG